MHSTPTHINYYHICHRKLWLFTHGINMEHTSDIVADGKLIHESSYPQRAAKYTEVDLGVAKIDYYDPINKMVHEVKRGRKMEEAHRWQVKYYLLLLEGVGIKGARGLLEYPALRKTEEVFLKEGDREYLKEVEIKIKEIVSSPDAPARIRKSFCRSCSYFDFCWSE